MEMSCYCEHCKCPHDIDYVHHHDWSSEEDFACSVCQEVCYMEVA